MDSRDEILARHIASVTIARSDQYARSLASGGVLQKLIADLIALREAAGMTQHDVAARMFTTRSAVCRLESGKSTRPTLRTIERYALAVGAQLEIRVRR